MGRPEQSRSAPEFGVAVFATETSVVENELVRHQPLHRVHSLLAGRTGLFHLSPQAKGLWSVSTVHSARSRISTDPFLHPHPPSGPYLRPLHGAAATAAFDFMRGGGLGGSSSLEHGSSEVFGGPGGDA